MPDGRRVAIGTKSRRLTASGLRRSLKATDLQLHPDSQKNGLRFGFRISLYITEYKPLCLFILLCMTKRRIRQWLFSGVLKNPQQSLKV